MQARKFSAMAFSSDFPQPRLHPNPMHTPSFFMLSFFIYLIHVPPCLSSQPQQAHGMEGRLIRRDSPLSPFYNPEATSHRSRARAWLRRSNSRIHYFQSLQQHQRLSATAPEATLRSVEGEYLMNFYIGTPPVQMWAAVDSGSALPWIQCLPCVDCFKMNFPTFNPAKSSTYEKTPCHSQICEHLGNGQCKPGEVCTYQENYLDGSMTKGNIAHEAFTFRDAENGNVTFRSIIFGCGRENTGVYNREEAGVIGLDRSIFSLVNQFWALRFVYCLAPFDKDGTGSRIIFGKRAQLSGSFTPMLKVKGQEEFYHLSLDGISVGRDRLPLRDAVFHADKNGEGGFMIDSGTTFTSLAREGYDVLIKALGDKITFLKRVNDPLKEFDLCYAASSYEDLAVTPDITFHFTGADVVLTKKGSYTQADDGLFCLAILPTTGVSLLGNMAQQNYIVGYDLNKEEVSFASMDCTRF